MSINHKVTPFYGRRTSIRAVTDEDQAMCTELYGPYPSLADALAATSQKMIDEALWLSENFSDDSALMDVADALLEAAPRVLFGTETVDVDLLRFTVYGVTQ